MLTYTPPSHPTAQANRKALAVAAIVLYLAVAGHFGPWPWKPDEPYALGVVQWMLHSGDWLTPRIAGEPYLDTHRCITGWLRCLPGHFLHGYCRCMTRRGWPSPLFMSLTLLFVGATARELIGRRHGRSAVLILIGCLGLIDTGHQLSADVAILCAEAACLLGLTLALRRGFSGRWRWRWAVPP